MPNSSQATASATQEDAVTALAVELRKAGYPDHAIPTLREFKVHRHDHAGADLAPRAAPAMPPIDRQHLADQCRRIAALADPPRNGEPKAGVLPSLKTTPRDE